MNFVFQINRANIRTLFDLCKFSRDFLKILTFERNVGLEPHPLLGREMLYQLSYITQY